METLKPTTETEASKTILVTSNPNKARISGVPNVVSTYFNEEEIKSGVPGNVLGYRYPLFISLEKARQQRKMMIEEEGESSDVIITSDSVVVLGGDINSGFVVNRDISSDNLLRANDVLKTGESIFFIGAVSFARLVKNSPIYQMLTYFRLTNPPRDLSLPIEIERLGSLDHEFGIINSSGRIVAIGKNDFQNGRPYISGLIPDFVRLVKEYSLLKKPEEILRQQIERYPFNTLIFYDLVQRGYDYKKIVHEWRGIFEENGGNCSFHSLFLATRLLELGLKPEIVLFPSENPDHENGHSAVKVGIFLFDPGLSIPYPIILSDMIQPITTVSGKRIFFYRDDNNNIHIRLVRGEKKIDFKISSIISINDFIDRLPSILSELHGKRKIAKIDKHDGEGRVLKRITIELNNSTQI